ncbi:hypothetical protein BDR26DRAFT_876135 [Obelidium mucronatum]|nr:hypothetical protein BDR26DRAFT_876135 [Obelidium mucronatum]
MEQVPNEVLLQIFRYLQPNIDHLSLSKSGFLFMCNYGVASTTRFYFDSHPLIRRSGPNNLPVEVVLAAVCVRWRNIALLLRGGQPSIMHERKRSGIEKLQSGIKILSNSPERLKSVQSLTVDYRCLPRILLSNLRQLTVALEHKECIQFFQWLNGLDTLPPLRSLVSCPVYNGFSIANIAGISQTVAKLSSLHTLCIPLTNEMLETIIHAGSLKNLRNIVVSRDKLATSIQLPLVKQATPNLTTLVLDIHSSYDHEDPLVLASVSGDLASFVGLECLEGFAAESTCQNLPIAFAELMQTLPPTVIAENLKILRLFHGQGIDNSGLPIKTVYQILIKCIALEEFAFGRETLWLHALDVILGAMGPNMQNLILGEFAVVEDAWDGGFLENCEPENEEPVRVLLEVDPRSTEGIRLMQSRPYDNRRPYWTHSSDNLKNLHVTLQARSNEEEPKPASFVSDCLSAYLRGCKVEVTLFND